MELMFPTLEEEVHTEVIIPTLERELEPVFITLTLEPVLEPELITRIEKMTFVSCIVITYFKHFIEKQYVS